MALCHFSTTHNLNNITIRLFIDNSSALSYLQRLKGGRKPRLNKTILPLYHLMKSRKIMLQAMYIESASNVIADSLSRESRDRNDYTLSTSATHKLWKIIGWTPTIDLTATKANRKVKRFVSRFPHPESTHVDVLSLTTLQIAGENAWTNPPWCIIPQLLKKIQQWQTEWQCSSTPLPPFRILMVHPSSPSRPWQSHLRKLATQTLPIAPHHGLFTNCMGEAMPAPHFAVSASEFTCFPRK